MQRRMHQRHLPIWQLVQARLDSFEWRSHCGPISLREIMQPQTRNGTSEASWFPAYHVVTVSMINRDLLQVGGCAS